MTDFDPARFKLLSRRENEVLYWTCRGWTRTQIAKCLKMNARTVNTYKDRMRVKLDLWSDIAIALHAYKYQVIEMDWL